jgi:hypothetical protein
MNIVLFTIRFLDVAKFTSLTPLSLWTPCKLSFWIVGLKISSLPTSAVMCPDKIFMCYLEKLSNTHYSSWQKLFFLPSALPSWGITLQNNDITPVTSFNIIWGVFTNYVTFANIAATLWSPWCACVQSLLIPLEGMDTICRQLNYVYASSCVFKMFKKIEKPTASEMWSVICLLNARNMKLAYIHQLCEGHGKHAMSDSMVRR